MHETRVALQQQQNQAARVANGKRADERRVGKRQEQNVQPQPGGERDEGNECRERLAPEQADRKANVGGKTGEHTDSRMQARAFKSRRLRIQQTATEVWRKRAAGVAPQPALRGP